MLSRPPKKPKGKEADEVDTATTVSCVTVSTCENRNKTVTNSLEHWKVPNMHCANENTRTEKLSIGWKMMAVRFQNQDQFWIPQPKLHVACILDFFFEKSKNELVRPKMVFLVILAKI